MAREGRKEGKGVEERECERRSFFIEPSYQPRLEEITQEGFRGFGRNGIVEMELEDGGVGDPWSVGKGNEGCELGDFQVPGLSFVPLPCFIL